MKTNAEKRACERRNYTVPIEFSYFNQNDWFDEVIRVKEIFEPLQVIDLAVHHG